MKTRIKKLDCIACGNCSAICPDVYDYDEEGIAYCKLDDNTFTANIPEEYVAEVKDALECCPVEAIEIEE